MSQENEIWKITQGILLLIGMHALVILIIFSVTYLLQITYGAYASLIIVFGLAGLFLIQLLYVIPICILLKRKRKYLIMKGVINGAIITALVNIICNLILFN